MDATAAPRPVSGPDDNKAEDSAASAETAKKILHKFSNDNHVRIDTMKRLWSKFTRMNTQGDNNVS